MLTGIAVGYALAHKDTPEIMQWTFFNFCTVVPRFLTLLWASLADKCSQRKVVKVPNLSVYRSQMNALDSKLSTWDPSKLEELLDSAAAKGGAAQVETAQTANAAEPAADEDDMPELMTAEQMAAELAEAVAASEAAAAEASAVVDTATVPAVSNYRTATELAAAGALMSMKKA